MTRSQIYNRISKAGFNPNHFSLAYGHNFSLIYEIYRFNTVGISNQVISTVISLFPTSYQVDRSEIIIMRKTNE